MVMPKLSATQLQSSARASVIEPNEQEQAGKLKPVSKSNHQEGQIVPEQTKQLPGYVNEIASSKGREQFDGRVDSFDHVTFWVGNARQSAVFYMTQLGFEPLAFRGLETGSRDLACHVLRLNDTIIQLVSAVEPNNQELNGFLSSHGDAVKDVAFRVENIEALLRHALDSGAELVNPLEVVTFDATSPNGLARSNNVGDESSEATKCLDKFVMKRATIKTFGDITHTFIERNYDYQLARFLPGYHKPSLEVSALFRSLIETKLLKDPQHLR
jgi:4-hydroxyphenylpyruvate dioxygenase